MISADCLEDAGFSPRAFSAVLWVLTEEGPVFSGLDWSMLFLLIDLEVQRTV